MYESVVCEHMPKTATAKNKAANWKKGGMVGKKIFNFLEKMGWSGDWKQNFFLVCFYKIKIVQKSLLEIKAAITRLQNFRFFIAVTVVTAAQNLAAQSHTQELECFHA